MEIDIPTTTTASPSNQPPTQTDTNCPPNITGDSANNQQSTVDTLIIVLPIAVGTIVIVLMITIAGVLICLKRSGKEKPSKK